MLHSQQILRIRRVAATCRWLADKCNELNLRTSRGAKEKKYIGIQIMSR